MNLKLEKIKRKEKLIDYSTISDYIKKKNGNIIVAQGVRNVVKIYSNKKINQNEEMERRIHFLSIVKNFNETFHIKPKHHNNSIYCKSYSSEIFFQNCLKKKNNNLFKNKTMNNFYKKKEIKKKPFNFKTFIKYNNDKKCQPINSNYKLIKRKQLLNEMKYKEIFEQFQKIKDIVHKNDVSSINNDEQIKDILIKDKSIGKISNIDSKIKDKIRFIKRIKNINKNKSMINLKKNKELHSFFKNFSDNIDNSNINQNYISKNVKNFSISSSIKDFNNDSYLSKLKLKQIYNNKNKSLEDDTTINSDFFKDYDFNPSKAFLELKDNYKFIEENNLESKFQIMRAKYLMRLRNAFNRNKGMKLQRNFILSAKRIKNIKMRSNIMQNIN